MQKSSVRYCQSTLVMYENDRISSPSWFYPRNTRLVQHLKINQYINRLNKKNYMIKREKSYNHLNRCRKAFDKIQHQFII